MYEYGVDFAGIDAIDFHTHVEIDSHGHKAYDDELVDATRNSDVLIPFGSVDPWIGQAAVRRVGELVDKHGVRGFKFHPSMQAFEPNDRRFYPIYQAIADAGVPALFHTGQTGIGSGLPGGHGIKLRYSDPMLLDDISADFPELTIAMHKSNVYIDLSGYSPKYFPPLVYKENALRVLGISLPPT